MPTYEYICLECKCEFEELQDIIDDPIEKCLKCGGEVKRLVSNSTICVTHVGKELYEKEILPEAKKIAEKIKDGDEDAAADIFGPKYG
jgi:putative FmdB family regulatory protein